ARMRAQGAVGGGGICGPTADGTWLQRRSLHPLERTLFHATFRLLLQQAHDEQQDHPGHHHDLSTVHAPGNRDEGRGWGSRGRELGTCIDREHHWRAFGDMADTRSGIRLVAERRASDAMEGVYSRVV